MVVSAQAAAQTAPLALIGPTAPVTVSFSEGAAPLTIVVANNTDKAQALEVKYVGTGAEERGLRAVDKATGTDLELVILGGRTVPSYDAAALRLEFHRAGNKPTLEGAVVVTAAASVVAVPVSESKTAAIIGFEQKTASISATTWVGPLARVCRWLSFGEHCPEDHYQSSSTTVSARGVVEHKTLVGGSSGKNATVKIEPAANRGGPPRQQATEVKQGQQQTPAVRPAPRPTRAKITATEVRTPGTYSGDVALDPAAAEPKTTAVTIHARDAILWPLLAISAGLGASWYLTKRREPRRIGQGLRASLQEAISPYLDRRAQREQRRPDRDYLDHLLVRSDSGLAPRQKQYPDAKRVKMRPAEEVPALYWDTYDIDDADKLADVNKRAATMIARFTRWLSLDDAFNVLDRAVANLPNDQPIYDHAQSVLDLAQGEPVDDDETQTRASAMTAWATMCKLYCQVADSFARAAARIPPPWFDQHRSLDAENIYAQVAPADTPEEVAALRLALLRARRLLVDPEKAPADEPQAGVIANLRAATADLDADFFAADTLAGGVFANLLAPLRYRFETAEDIRRNVREWDWVVFLVISFLTALAYTLAFYAGKDWGSPMDYLTAFVAGATVPTVINWALLPSSRPLTPSVPATTAS